MSYPVDNQKKFEEWSFDDLVSWAAWKVASNLIKGIGIKECMYEVISTARSWNRPQDSKIDDKKHESKKR